MASSSTIVDAAVVTNNTTNKFPSEPFDKPTSLECVVFLIDGRRFYVERAVVFAASRVLRTNVEWAEEENNENGSGDGVKNKLASRMPPEIELKEVDAPTFDTFLHLIAPASIERRLALMTGGDHGYWWRLKNWSLTPK